MKALLIAIALLFPFQKGKTPKPDKNNKHDVALKEKLVELDGLYRKILKAVEKAKTTIDKNDAFQAGEEEFEAWIEDQKDQEWTIVSRITDIYQKGGQLYLLGTTPKPIDDIKAPGYPGGSGLTYVQKLKLPIPIDDEDRKKYDKNDYITIKGKLEVKFKNDPHDRHGDLFKAVHVTTIHFIDQKELRPSHNVFYEFTLTEVEVVPYVEDEK